jgi:hypothetical protein
VTVSLSRINAARTGASRNYSAALNRMVTLDLLHAALVADNAFRGNAAYIGYWESDESELLYPEVVILADGAKAIDINTGEDEGFFIEHGVEYLDPAHEHVWGPYLIDDVRVLRALPDADLSGSATLWLPVADTLNSITV